MNKTLSLALVFSMLLVMATGIIQPSISYAETAAVQNAAYTPLYEGSGGITSQ